MSFWTSCLAHTSGKPSEAMGDFLRLEFRLHSLQICIKSGLSSCGLLIFLGLSSIAFCERTHGLGRSATAIITLRWEGPRGNPCFRASAGMVKNTGGFFEALAVRAGYDLHGRLSTRLWFPWDRGHHCSLHFPC